MLMKNLMLAALLLLLASQAHAQFGIKGGVNEAVLTGRVGELGRCPFSPSCCIRCKARS
jgi:hypothetical protein